MNDFNPPHPLNTAVLFLIFNRLDTTKQVFEAIRQAKPPRLYVAADGARANKEGEAEKVHAVRDYILQNINWECEVKTLFREKNLGCKYAVSGAIDWFFENEEMGIILEDDCLPEISFFWYCEELLNKYKNDLRIWHINGNNFDLNVKNNINSSYTFTRFPQVWGWASWSNRWKSYDKNLSSWVNNSQNTILALQTTLNISKQEALTLKNNFKKAAMGQIDTWDYQWQATVILNHGIVISPKHNLISNLGYGLDATHTKGDDKRTFLQTAPVALPLKHQVHFLINSETENFYKAKMNIKKNKIQLLKNKLIKTIKK